MTKFEYVVFYFQLYIQNNLPNTIKYENKYFFLYIFKFRI